MAKVAHSAEAELEPEYLEPRRKPWVTRSCVRTRIAATSCFSQGDEMFHPQYGRSFPRSGGVAMLPLLSILLVAFTAVSYAGTPVSEVCRTPSLAINDNQTSTDTLIFTDELEIEDTEVYVDLTHTFIGDLTLTIMSPAGTQVTLHSGQGGSNNNMRLTYTDSGIPNSNPYFCDCDMQPSSGAMSSFDAETSNGTWTFTVSDAFNGDQGTVNEWCVGIFGTFVAAFVRGDSNGDGSVVGIVDGIHLLNYQFVAGSSAPPCMDAADVDNDGVFNGLVDAAALLNFIFATGNPPPAPYPGCGSDDDDALGCLTPPALCN